MAETIIHKNDLKEELEIPPSRNSELRSAGAMSVAVLFSRVLGLVREQVFAAFFGASNAADAFQIAFRIPNLLRDLFAEGAMSAALVPTFIRVRQEQGIDRGWQLASRVFGLLFLIASVVAACGAFFSDRLVEIYASAFHNIPGKFELTVGLTQEMMTFFPMVALAAAFMSVLNACGRFFIPALSSAAFNLISVVIGVVFIPLAPRIGHAPIEGMAFGVVLGGVVQAAVQIPTLIKSGFRWQWSTPQSTSLIKDRDLRRMLALMIPGTFGLAATQINILVNSILATGQSAGSVSWLNYAFRLMQFPIGVFGVSLATATLPLVSRKWVQKDFQGSKEAIESSVERVFAINFPAAAGLAGPFIDF